MGSKWLDTYFHICTDHMEIEVKVYREQKRKMSPG